MIVRVHGKNLPKKFRLGVYGMAELTMRDLLDNRRVVNNLEIDSHFRHHADLSIKAKGMYWKGELTSVCTMMEYFKCPWEVEAYGLERYLWMNFIDFWSKNVEKKLDMSE